MGTFHYTIEIGTPDGSIYKNVDALVDTGASYTVVPALLRRLGVDPAEVVFGEEGTEPLLRSIYIRRAAAEL